MPRVKKREIARPTRLKLMLRRQRRNLRFVVWGASGFAIVMLGVVVVHSAQKGGRVAKLQAGFGKAIDLRVRDIVIDGRANTPEPLLRAALGVSIGDPILGFSVDGARQRIETLSWVDHVAVERRLPGTIFVDIAERRPFAIWQNQGKFQLIDRDGEVVANEDVAAFTDLPLVVGAGAPAHAAFLLDALTASPDLRSRIAASVRVGERRWNLQLHNGITVMLPEGHEPAAIERLVSLQQRQSLLDRPLSLVDMRLPDRLALRAKTAAVAPADIQVPPAHAPDAHTAEPHTPDAARDNPNRRAT